mgnify:CR=1 FL=1
MYLNSVGDVLNKYWNLFSKTFSDFNTPIDKTSNICVTSSRILLTFVLSIELLLIGQINLAFRSLLNKS